MRIAHMFLKMVRDGRWFVRVATGAYVTLAAIYDPGSRKYRTAAEAYYETLKNKAHPNKTRPSLSHHMQ
jgi:hypothetical protein